MRISALARLEGSDPAWAEAGELRQLLLAEVASTPEAPNVIAEGREL